MKYRSLKREFKSVNKIITKWSKKITVVLVLCHQIQIDGGNFFYYLKNKLSLIMYTLCIFKTTPSTFTVRLKNL